VVYPEPGTVNLKVKNELASSLDVGLKISYPWGSCIASRFQKCRKSLKAFRPRHPGVYFGDRFYNGLTSLRTAVVKERGSGRDYIRKNPKGLIINPCYSIAGVLVSN
jgi:hypothetical protein